MGIYDRDYYRDGPGFLGRLAEQGKVTSWLIAITSLCFIVQFLTGSRAGSPVTDALVLDVNKVLRGEVWRLLTYAFLHSPDNILHILFNMLLLFWFGRQVEDVLGSREYLWFYLVSASLGGVAFTAACLLHLHGFPYPQCLGASGAVTAVLVLAAIFNPRQVIYVMLLIPVPIWAFVVLNVVIDAFNLISAPGHGVATSAHLGGAAFGYLYHRLGWRLSGWTRWFTGWKRSRSRARLRLYREDEETPTPLPSPRPAPTAPSRLLDDEHLEAQMDAILEKIQRVGMEGLTENERQILVRASEAIKRRRG